ncbi:hypothetical protein A9Q99_25580 [Gammaproteobacteria bacterium 45_16_T64]|nr:hypothetical protein A9Q99_25580 [Gammaproteobacteria bacterium 45_16_T64]
MADTLFDKYGGFATFSAVVSNFYKKIMDSDELIPYFDGIDMDKLMDHQTNFIARALGGPDKYSGRDLKKVHARFNITQPHFGEVAELLTEALEEAGVAGEDVETIIGVVGSLQDQIVSG